MIKKTNKTTDEKPASEPVVVENKEPVPITTDAKQHSSTWVYIGAGAAAFALSAYIGWALANDATGIGVVDDWTIAPASAALYSAGIVLTEGK